MQIQNSSNRYGIVAMLLHWLMAVLIIGLIIFGIWMVRLPISLQKLKWYGWHKGYGMLRSCWCAHAAAALQHHFYHKDDILRRMLP